MFIPVILYAVVGSVYPCTLICCSRQCLSLYDAIGYIYCIPVLYIVCYIEISMACNELSTTCAITDLTPGSPPPPTPMKIGGGA